MSSVDNRIVQMQFENSQFEKGIRESLKSIEDLEKKLKFEDAEKGLALLQKAGDSFSLATMAQGIERISEKFSLMGVVGRRVLENLTDQAVRASEKFVKSITTDQISEGWKKYAEKTSAVQTIIAATGADISYVNDQLSKLAWFTDETSYNFVDMTNNIGKFTSMGIDLETSVTAMEGIATWAAVSGQNASTAGRAMYNLSQAIGVGAVKLMDWKSIENANMATKEFKETAIETAKALGKLNKEGKTAKGTAVTFENFSQTLSEGWFTKDVLLKTLDKYGNYANAVYEIAIEKGIPAAEAMKLVTDQTMKLGEKAFKAAQEAKTFTEAIGATKDAVSSGWMNIFENIFGNYEEAKVLWTDLANYLWDMFAAPLSDTNDLISEWKELGGRTKVLKGIYAIFQSIADIVATVKDAIASVIPPITVERLLELSDAVAEFGENFRKTFNRYEFTFTTVKAAEDKLSKLISENNFGFESRGEAVKELQTELKELGYLKEEDYTSGIWGPSTQKAFENFQNGLGTTKEKIDSTFNLGDKSEDVAELQKKLKELGFDPGTVDGIYGKKTEKAFKDYKASLESADKERKELAKGARGEDVKELQRMLVESGVVDDLKADGVFGPKTEEALKKWQKAQGLDVNGVFDTKSIEKMFPKTISEGGDAIERGTHTLVDYSDKMQNLYYIVQGVTSVFHIITSVLSFFGRIIGHIGSLLMPLVDAFIAITAAVANSITAFDQWLQESGTFDKWFEDVKKFLQPFGDWVSKAAEGLLRFFGITKSVDDSTKDLMTLPKLFSKLKDAIKKTGIVDKVSKAWNNLTKSFKTLIPVVKAHWKAFKKSLGEKFQGFLSGLPEKISAVTGWLGNLASKGLEKITSWIQKIPGGIEKIKSFWAALTQKGDPASGKAPGFLTRVKNAFQNVIDFLFGEGDISHGKKPGLFRKIGQLLSGDLDGFTEGMDENKKQEVLARIQSIKDFLQKIREALILLFGGELEEDRKISDETVEKIESFKKGIKGVFDAIKMLFTGKIDEDSVVPDSVRQFIINFRESISKVFDAIKLLITGEVSKDTKLSQEAIDKINTVRDTISGIIDVIKETVNKIKSFIADVFSGKISFSSPQEFFTSLWEGIKNFVASITGVISEHYDGAIEKAGESLSKIWDSIKKIGKWVIIGIVVYKLIKMLGGITGAFNKLKDVIASFKQKTQPLSKSIMQFAIAIGIIAASIFLIGQLKPDQLKRGLGSVAGIVAALFIFMGIAAKIPKDATKSVKNIGAAILDLAIAIGVIALTIFGLSLIPEEQLKNGLLKLAGLMLVVIAFMWALNKAGATKFKMAGIWQIAILIGIMALIASSLGKLDDKRLKKGLLSLFVIMAMIAGLFAVIGAVQANKIKFKGIWPLVLIIGVMSIVVSELGKLDDERLKKGLLSLFVIMAMIAGLFAVIGTIGNGINIKSAIVTFLGIAALVGVMAFALNKVKDIDPWVIVAFTGGLSLLVSVLAPCITTLSSIPIVGALKAAVVLVAVLGALALGIAMFGQLTSAAVDGFTSTLYLVGGRLESFSNTMANVDSTSADKAKDFITTMAGAIASIASSFLGLIAIDDFCVALTRLGSSMMLFSIMTSDVSEEKSAAFTKYVGAIIAGINDLSAISDKAELIEEALNAIGGSLNLFYSNVSGTDTSDPSSINTDAVQSAFDALRDLNIDDSVIAKFAAYSDNEGSGLGDFAVGITNLSTAISKYSEEITKLNFGSILVANFLLDGIASIKERVTSVDDFDGFAQAIRGHKRSFTLFIDDIAALGTALSNYSDNIGGLDLFQILKANYILETIAGINEGLGFSGGLFGLLFGEQNLGQFATNIQDIGNGLRDFMNAISGAEYDKEKIDAAMTPLTIMGDLQSKMGRVNGLKQLFEGSQNLGTLGEQLYNFGVYLVDFAAETADFVLTDNIKDILGVIGELAVLQSSLSLSEGDFYPLYEIGFSLESFFGSLARISDSTSGSFTDGQTVEDALNAAEWIKAIDPSAVVTAITDYFDTIITSVKDGDKDLESELTATGKTLGSAFNEGFSESNANNINDMTTMFAESLQNNSSSFTDAGSSFATAVNAGLSSGNANGAGYLAAKLLSKLTGTTSQFRVAGENFALGVGVGINVKAEIAVEAARALAQAALDKIREVFAEASPSKATAKIGEYFSEGLSIGISDKQDSAVQSVDTMANSMLDTARGPLATLSSLLSEDIDDTPVIRPVVDLTNARYAASSIGSMFGTQSFGVETRTMAGQTASSIASARASSAQASSSGSGSTSKIMDMLSVTNAQLASLSEEVANMQIVLDSGVLVGQIGTKMDKKLGSIATAKRRLG